MSKILIVLFVWALCSPWVVFGQVKPDWKAEWGKTLAAAKKEGQLTAYISGYDGVIPAFQKAYPDIKVILVTGRGSQLGPRILAERRAKKYLTDIYSGGSTTPYKLLHRSKALDPIRSAMILPEVVDQSKWWRGQHRYIDPEGSYIFAYTGNVGGGGIIHYNTKLVGPREFKSYWDILDPKWKGKIVVRDIRRPGPGSGQTRFLWNNPEIGPEFVRRLYSEMNITLSRDRRQPVDWLARGKFSLSLFSSGVGDAKLQGLPVDTIPPHVLKEGDPVSVGLGTLSLVKQAPHPNAAKVFINWLLSREGQIALQKAQNTPETAVESLREDIPKDAVREGHRRKKGAKYVIVDRVDWMDLSPVYKLIGNVTAKKRRK